MNKLTSSQIENFVSEFNSCFGAPFLPDGFARASVAMTGGLRIFVGNRDIQFDQEMHIVGRGTDLTADLYGNPMQPPTSFTPIFKEPANG